MNITEKVLEALKPQVASYGFSKEEVKSIATQVADNLKLSEEASEEDMNAAVTNGINAVIPFLKVGQQMATRVINVAKKQQQEALEAEKKRAEEEAKKQAEKEAEEAAEKAAKQAEAATKAAQEALKPAPKPAQKPTDTKPIEQPTSVPTAPQTTAAEEPAWLKQLIEQNSALVEQNNALANQMKQLAEQSKSFQQQSKLLNEEIAAIKGEKTLSLRKSKLEELLKDTGTFGKRTLKTFSKMNFKDDAAFDDFYSDVEEDLKEYNQERANEGLAKLGAPAIGLPTSKKEPEKLSDAEIADLAEKF